MSRRVVVPCPSDGLVVLGPEGVTVHVSRVHGAGARYSFDCPVCQVRVSMAGGYRDIKALLHAGAAANLVPLEVLEHPTSTVPPISEGELEGFLEQLDDPNVLAEFARP